MQSLGKEAAKRHNGHRVSCYPTKNSKAVTVQDKNKIEKIKAPKQTKPRVYVQKNKPSTGNLNCDRNYCTQL